LFVGTPGFDSYADVKQEVTNARDKAMINANFIIYSSFKDETILMDIL